MSVDQLAWARCLCHALLAFGKLTPSVYPAPVPHLVNIMIDIEAFVDM